MSLVWLLVLRATRNCRWKWDAYDAYLASETWRRRARAYLQHVADLQGRHEARCEECGQAHADHVHHVSYRLVGWEPRRHLRALCWRCHSLAHGRLIHRRWGGA